MGQDLVAVYALRESDLTVNERNANEIIKAIANNKWFSQIPRPLSYRLRGRQQIVDLENAVRSLVNVDAYNQVRDQRGKVVMSRYNHAAAGGEALRNLNETNPMAAAWVHSRRSTPCLLYTSPSPRDRTRSRMPSSA